MRGAAVDLGVLDVQGGGDAIPRWPATPGTDTGDTMLSHDGEEGGVIVQGRVEITVGELVRVLGPGESYYFESRKPHRFRNVGKGNAILVSASTPPTF